MTRKWDEQHVCPVCHGRHRQISPACLRRRRVGKDEIRPIAGESRDTEGAGYPLGPVSDEVKALIGAWERE